MFVFSEQHDWQGDAGVKQILVFPTQDVKDLFDHEIESRFNVERAMCSGNPTDAELCKYVSDSNAGAVYKLRAVLNGDDTMTGVIRCGVTGGLILESARHTNVDHAFLWCFKELHSLLSQALIEEQLKIVRKFD